MSSSQPYVSAAGMRIVKLLVGNKPRTVAELINGVGVTRTAIADQLSELTAAGLVERTTDRKGARGRPRHLYRATGAALGFLFASNQALVVPAMWNAIQDVGGEGVMNQVRKRTGELLGEHYGKLLDGATPAERFRQIGELLRNEGVLVDVAEEEGERLVLRKRSCPFITMHDPSSSVCLLDVQMMIEAVGAPVRQIENRHQGDACCAFELVLENGRERPSDR